jgi:hypothetical protein
MPDHNHIELDHKPTPLFWSDGSCSFVSQPVVASVAALSVPLVPPLTWPASLFADAAVVEIAQGPQQ